MIQIVAKPVFFRTDVLKPRYLHVAVFLFARHFAKYFVHGANDPHTQILA